MGSYIAIDFETRSACDLKRAGLDNYSRHATTEPWCMGWCADDGDVQLWELGQRLPEAVYQAVITGQIFVAHNAAFELALWNNCCAPRYGWPMLKPEQMRCTMAMAYAMALPGSLEKAAAAVGISEQKDLAGGRMMMQLSQPRAITGDNKIVWWDDDLDRLIVMYDYCRQDVRVERQLFHRLMALSPAEQDMWNIDYRINQRGIYVDRKAIEAILRIVMLEKEKLDIRMRELTGNFVGFCTEVKRIGDWLRAQGLAIDGLAKADVLDALESKDLTPVMREVLQLRQMAGKTSTAKLTPMLEAASLFDGRIRGTLQYHGAGTGRWAGRRVQFHNFPRPKIKPAEVDDVLNMVVTSPPEDVTELIRAFIGPPLDVVSSCLRSLVCAEEGHELYAADFANIEGRGLAWLAGEEWKLKAFREFDSGVGPDLYLVSAGRIYGKDASAYDKDSFERQHGKVAELACGYGGGVGAFQTMATTYGVKVSDTLAEEIKTRWRDAHPETVRYWYMLEEAAIMAVKYKGDTFTAGSAKRAIKFKMAGSFLWCLLPSGRTLCYPYPKILEVETPWGSRKDALTYMTVLDEQQKKKGKAIPDPNAQGDWQRISTYGGKLAENVTQAICRDLLAEAIKRCEKNGWPVVLHVHDEIVAEVAKNHGELKSFEKICSEIPGWADGLPIVAKGWTGKRYRK